MLDNAPPRAVRSFVNREGRMTPAQRKALTELLPKYRVDDAALTRGCDTLFRQGAPLHLEIGSGNGANALALAAREPGINLIASEVHRPGLGHTLLELQRLGLDNLRLFDRDAHELLAALPPASLEAVYIFFPDPWPKTRHHKRRLVQPALLELLATRLQRHGRVYFATDHEDYALEVRALVTATPGWVNLAGADAWAPRPNNRIVTRFEQRALSAAHAVYELVWAPHSRS